MKKWNEFYEACLKYLYENETLAGIRKDCKIGKYNFGVVASQVRRGVISLTPEQKAKLDAIGFDWTVQKRNIFDFESIYKMLIEFKEKYGHCLVGNDYITESGVNLGHIVSNIRSGHRRVSLEEKEKLNSIGFAWAILPNERSNIIRSINKIKNEKIHTSTQKSVIQKEDRRTQNTRFKDDSKFYYVFDTSIASEINAWNKVFDEIIKEGNALILTSVVLFELDKLQNYQPQDRSAYGARKLLVRIVEDDENFEVERIECGNDEIHDDAIIRFCIGKSNVGLITADKVMALKARMEKINTKYIKKEKLERFCEVDRNDGITYNDSTDCNETCDVEPNCSIKDDIQNFDEAVQQSKTIIQKEEKIVSKGENKGTRHSKDVIPGAYFCDGQLMIDEFNTDVFFIKVFSKFAEYSWGPIALSRDDEVFVIIKTDSPKEVIFEHYKVTNITPEKNAVLINRKMINVESWSKLQNTKYRKFVASYSEKLKSA